MKTFSVSTSIEASPEAIWGLLTDAAGFPGWDPTYTRIEGRIALGEKITLHHRTLKPEVLAMMVSAFEPARLMVWTGGGMPAAMFKGERIFTLQSAGGGAAFSMQLVFSGIMASVLIGATDMQPRLDEFAAALKRRAEQGGPRPAGGPASTLPAGETASDTPSITIVRRFAAPVAEVFEAWTDPVLLRQWLAPGPCTVVESTADPRPGGKYKITVLDPAGGRHVTSGEYREVVRDRRLVQTWDYVGHDAPPAGYPTLLTVDFRDVGPGSTEITLLHEQLLTDADREGNRAGWRLCFEKLDALLGKPA
jgi:uncharacterized protein YndB with AHSA1/START domain